MDVVETKFEVVSFDDFATVTIISKAQGIDFDDT